MMKAKNRKIMLITAVVIVVVLAIILAMLFTRCGDHSSATPDQAQVTQATSVATTVKETTAVKSSESETVDATAPTTSKTDPTASVKATEAKPSSSSSSKSDSSSSSKPSSSGGSTSSKPSGSTSSKPSSGGSSSSKPSSGSSSSSSSSSDPHAGKTYHEAVYEDVWVVDQEAYSYEEPVYEKRVYTICHVCGAEFDTTYGGSEFWAHDDQHLLAGEGSGYHNETRNIQTGTKTVNVPEEGHWEKKLVKEAGWY